MDACLAPAKASFLRSQGMLDETLARPADVAREVREMLAQQVDKLLDEEMSGEGWPAQDVSIRAFLRAVRPKLRALLLGEKAK